MIPNDFGKAPYWRHAYKIPSFITYHNQFALQFTTVYSVQNLYG